MTISRFYNKPLLAGAAAFCAILLLTAIALAAPTHHSNVVAKLCQNGTTLNLAGSATSWRPDSNGTNTSVIVTARVIGQNNSVNYINVASGVYTTTANNTLDFHYDGLPASTISVTVYAQTAGTWGDGTTNKSLNNADAVFIGDCVPDKLTPTPEPPSPTPTNTASVTPSATATATTTLRPTTTGTQPPPTPTNTNTPTRPVGTSTVAPSPTRTPTITATPTKEPAPTPNCSLIICTPTGETEIDEAVTLRFDEIYNNAEGQTFARYTVICAGVRHLAVEFIFTDDARYRSESIGCSSTLYVPEGTQMIVISDADTERVLLEKEPPVEISDPPVVIYMSSIYLPIVTR